MTPHAVPLLLLAGALALPAPRPGTRVARTGPRRPNPALIPVAVAAVVFAAFALGRAGVVIAGSIAGATAVRAVASRRATHLAQRSSRAAADFIGHLADSVGAGSPLHAAAEHAAEHLPHDAPPAVRRDIAQFVAAARRGAAPAELAPNLATPELARVAKLWSLSAARGVPIAGLLDAAREEIDHAQRHRAATDAALAGPRTTAVVLSLLPLAGVAMGTAMGANPVGFLLDDGLGAALLVAGTALVCAGVLACDEIIRRAAA